MFARKLRVEIERHGDQRPCPLDWLVHFFMRHFTGLRALENTLPAAEGLLEVGLDVDLEILQREFETWLRGRKMITPEEHLLITRT